MNDLTDVKVGDKLMHIAYSNWGNSLRIIEVERTTNTQLVVKDKRIKKADGYEIGTRGGGWNSNTIHWKKYDEAKVVAFRAKMFESKIESIKNKLGDDYTLEIINRLKKDLEVTNEN